MSGSEKVAFSLICLLAVPCFFLSPWLDAWAICKVWHWFLESSYGPAPSRLAVVGVAIIVRFLTYQEQEGKAGKRDAWEILGRMLFWTIIKQPIAVGCAWLVWRVLF